MSISALAAAGTITQSGLSGISTGLSFSGPARRNLNYQMNSFNPNTLPTLGEMFAMLRWNIGEWSDYVKWMEMQGYSNEMAKLLWNASHTVMNPSDVIALKRRGLINEKTMSQMLERAGIPISQQDVWVKSTLVYPNLQDVITMAVREVYNPAQRAQLKLDSDYPQDLDKWADILGFNKSFAKDMWAAHWKLPSPSMVFEMLHRGVITDIQEVRDYLKAADYSPAWRDKLIKISYHTLTRVDVRRMYRIGVMDEEQLLKAYKNIGYNDEDAQHMVDFTVKYENQENVGVSRALLVKNYKLDLMTKEELIEALMEIDLSANAANLVADTAEAEKLAVELEELVEELKTLYAMGSLTKDDIRARLDAADAPAHFTESVIAKLDLQESKRIKQPARTDLSRWLRRGIINDNTYLYRMQLLGYTREDSLLFLTENTDPSVEVKVKYLSEAKYVSFYIDGLMSEEEFITVLTAKGIRKNDIEDLLTQAKNKKGAKK